MSSHLIFLALVLCVGAISFVRARSSSSSRKKPTPATRVRAPQMELSSGDDMQFLINADAASVGAADRTRVRAFVTELEAEFGERVRFDEVLDGSFVMNLREHGRVRLPWRDLHWTGFPD